MLIRDFPGFGNEPKQGGVEYKRKNDPKWYKLWPGSTAIVDPQSKAKGTEKVRGRKCMVLWMNINAIAGIRYLDSGRYGERSIPDLIPVPSEPINMEVYRTRKATQLDK